MLRIFLGMALVAAAAPLAAQQVPILLHAARMLDGTGGARSDGGVPGQGGRILNVGPHGAAPPASPPGATAPRSENSAATRLTVSDAQRASGRWWSPRSVNPKRGTP